VLRVVHRLYPPTIGGVSFHAHSLSADQARRGHKVTVLTSLEDKYPQHELKEGYEILRFRALARPWDNPMTVGMLGTLLARKEDSFDILHAHSHLMFTTNLSAIKRRVARKPFVITNHGFGVSRGPFLEVAQKAYMSSVGKWTLAQADYVISFTTAEKNRVVRAGVPSDQAIVIPNGVDMRLFRPEPRGGSRAQVVLWTGRYVAEKGVRHLLGAARIVANEFRESKFILAGYGEELPTLVDLSRRLKLERNVVFLSPRLPHEIVNLLSQCTLFALPSLSEGFPSSVLEAMSCARPVVVTSHIGLEEVVGDAGLYESPGDEIGLAKSITALLRDRKLAASLGRRGRERVRKYYDWQKMVSATDDLFEKAKQEKAS
jgi:glycosyltransferase involved in cell wall biosynthesis